MKDLIIIIIAIALSAAMAGASLYYGGNGYMATNAKASATQIVNYLANYQQALNMWAQRNGGYPIPNNSFPIGSSLGYYDYTKSDIDSFLVPRYMQTNNLLPKLVSGSNFFYYLDPAIAQNGVLAVFLGSNDQKICGAIETLRTNAAPNYRTWNYGASQANNMFCGNFGCLINNGGWGSTTTYPYVVYTRTNGRPNINYADVDPVTCN